MQPESSRHLAILHTVAAALSRSLDLEQIFEIALDALTHVTGHEISSLHLLTPDRQMLMLRGDRGFTEALRAVNRVLPVAEGIIGGVAVSGQTLVFNDVRAATDLWPPARAVVEAEGIRGFVCVPIRIHGRILGTLSLGRRLPEPFLPEDVRLLEATADQIAVALDNGRLYAETRERLEEVKQNQAALLLAEARAEEANRAKDQFLAVLSHELRAPLQSMLAWVRLLRNRSLDEAASARALEVIERNVRSQAQLVGDLLDMSFIVAGKLRINRSPVDLVRSVQEGIDVLRREIETRRLILETRIDASVPLVLGDRVRLEQIVVNLISNAAKFTPSGGRITVSLGQHGGLARLRVTDTGQGIDKAVLPHIFERFRQADSTSRRGQGGLGLGLAIVRHLVDLHGGVVWAESAGVGKGATFTVELPILESPPPGATAREDLGDSRRGPEMPLRGLRVLAVDDDADTLEVVRLVLHDSGANVLVASSVGEALAALRHATVDVLISDLGMPGADGYDLIRQVRGLEREMRGQLTPAVALTGYASDEDRARALTAGFQMYAAKPVDPAQLVELTARAAGRPGATPLL
jgi:signal transduction histidine kinase/ActR/RegA family two-component response regulator